MRPGISGLIAPLLACALCPAGRAQDSREDLKRELGDLWVEQRYERLLEKVEPHLSDRRETAELWMMAAEAWLKTEEVARAIGAFERAVRLAPELGAAGINLGFAYLKADRPDDAERIFGPFLKDSAKGRAAKAHYGLGLVHSTRGDTTKAKDAFEKAAGLNPEDLRATYRLGQIALQAGDPQTARVHFVMVMREDELHHGAAHGLARATSSLEGADRAADAQERHRKILEVSDALPGMIRRLSDAPDPVLARLAISDRLREAGALKTARAWFVRAAKLDPSHPEIVRRLKREPADSRPESRG
jgi:tetratricopeptide (TPR) repeat protein